MTRNANILYSLAFILVMLALALTSLPGATSFSASRDTTLLDGKLTSSFEKHYDKGFVLKNFGTNVWAALEYGLFGEGRPGVVIGQEGWLYTSEEFNPALKASQIEDNWRLIGRVRDELQRRGIALELALLPAKARTYPEHLGEELPTAAHRNLYGDALARLQSMGMSSPDLYAVMQQGKDGGQVFLRTDTHWTPYGAELAARALAGDLRRRNLWQGGETQYETRVTGHEDYKGDLLTYLPLDPYFVALQPAQDTLEKRVTEQSGEGGDLFGSNDPQLALVGTSYSANPRWNFLGALRQQLGADLYNYAEDGHGPLVPMLRLLAKGEEETQGLKLVVWEVPERYLTLASDLSEFDPQWLAQLGTGREPADQLAGKGTARSLAAH